MENLEGKRRNDRGRRQRLFPKQLQGLWQSLAVGNSSQGPGIAKVTPPLFCDEEKHSEGDQKKALLLQHGSPFHPDWVGEVLHTHFLWGGKIILGEEGRFGGGEVENVGGEEAAGSEGVGQELTPTHLTPGAPSPRTLLQAAFWQLVFPPRTTLGFVTAWEVLGMCISVALDTLSQQAAAWTSSVNPSRCVLTQPAVLSQYGGFFGNPS